MSSEPTVPRWVRATMWSIAVMMAFAGVVLAVVAGSVWPLIGLLGLALPMVSVGSHAHPGRGAGHA